MPGKGGIELFNKEDYLCLSAMLRARETKMISSAKLERMLEAATFEDAAKVVQDSGYEDMSTMSAKEIETVLNNKRKELFDEIANIVPQKELVDLFKLKYDYHNAKVILKSEAMGLDAFSLMSGSGRLDPAELKTLYEDEKYSYMPAGLGAAMSEAKEVLARTNNPQQADFVLDRAFFGELTELASKVGNDFVSGYVKMLIDSTNLKSAVRTMRMGKGADFLSMALIKGGNVADDRILAAPDKDSIASMFTFSKLEKAAQLGAEAVDGGQLTEFEKACDDAVNSYIGGAKLVAYGPEAVVAYLSAIENEITAIRMVLTGRLADVKSSIIRERLRDMYA